MFSSMRRNVYGKAARPTSSCNDASSSAMMACLGGAVVIDALKWDGIVIVSWLEDASRDFCRAVVPLRDGNVGVSNTRALFPLSALKCSYSLPH